MGKNIVYLLMGLLLVCCGPKKNQELSGEHPAVATLDSLTTTLQDILGQGHINGFGVAIVHQDTTLYAKGFGFADVENKIQYTEHTLQNIGSVSKTVIGLALMKAEEMGKLDLDDPINEFLPFQVTNPTYPDQPITIRHLATHSSTILDTDFYNDKAYILKEDTPNVGMEQEQLNEQFNPSDFRMPMLDFLEKLLSPDGAWYGEDGFSKNKPGAVFEYSNVGATLAAAILEIAVDQPYHTFTVKHILNPLQMDSSGWSFDTIDMERHSTLYADPGNALPHYSLITYPDGGLITSISDFGKYLRELIKGHSGKGTLLKGASYSELFREQLAAESFPDRDEEDDYDDEYNTGIFMGFTPRGYIGHTGGDPGIAAYMFFDPDTGIGRILMINTSVRNSEGVNEFYAIWNALGVYGTKISHQISP